MKNTLKHYRSLFLLLGLTFIVFAYTAMAQSPSPSPVDPMAPVPMDEFLKLLMASIGGMGGATALTIAAVVVQLIVAFLKTDLMGNLFKNIDGIWKIAIVMGLTLVSGVLSLLTQGVSIGAALIHSTTLSALMVLGNQIYQHYKTDIKQVPAEPAK